MTEEARQCIENWNAKKNTKLPLIYKGLTCRQLPPFPDGVQHIIIRDMTLDEIPPIPQTVEVFALWRVNVATVPVLPHDLGHFIMLECNVRILPPLHCMSRWKHVSCQGYIQNCPNLVLQREVGEFMYEYAERWNKWWEC